MDERYLKQVALVVDALQYVAKEPCFALKGGTAINLFYNNLPRLSVDIDLTYIGFESRQKACQNINSALERVTSALNHRGYNANLQGQKIEKKIICSSPDAMIKIEPNYIIRGYIYEPKVMSVCKQVEENIAYAEIKVVSKPELYGGKICAALDRQHPRDLFDIKEFFKNNTFDKELLKGFIGMLLSHDKPLHETLNPRIKNQKEIFDKQFVGMSNIPFTYEDHIQTLNNLIRTIKQSIVPYKNLLLDFVSLKTDLNDFGINNLDKLPAVKWKIQNLKKLQQNNPLKFAEQYDKLKEYLDP